MEKNLTPPKLSQPDQLWFGYLFRENSLRILLVILMNVFGFSAINISVSILMSDVYYHGFNKEFCYLNAAACFCMAVSFASAGRLSKFSRGRDRAGAYVCIGICLIYAGLLTLIHIARAIDDFLKLA